MAISENKKQLLTIISTMIAYTYSKNIRIINNLSWNNGWLDKNKQVIYCPGYIGKLDILVDNYQAIEIKTYDLYYRSMSLPLSTKYLKHGIKVWLNPLHRITNQFFFNDNDNKRGWINKYWIKDNNLENLIRYTDAGKSLTSNDVAHCWKYKPNALDKLDL